MGRDGKRRVQQQRSIVVMTEVGIRLRLMREVWTNMKVEWDMGGMGYGWDGILCTVIGMGVWDLTSDTFCYTCLGSRIESPGRPEIQHTRTSLVCLRLPVRVQWCSDQ